MIKRIAPLCGLALALYGMGQAQACTADEATAKAQELAAKIEEITQRDPQRAAVLREELKQTQPESSSQHATDCDAYDHSLQELEEIGGEVEKQVQ